MKQTDTVDRTRVVTGKDAIHLPAIHLRDCVGRMLSGDELRRIGGGLEPHVHGKTNW